jgi:hypothetical protein
MKKIIIIGYPKSGNTWICRLTGELANCPIEGFLYSDYEEIAKEGGERQSEFGIYKSHHQLFELTEEDIRSSKLIYVIRDPRDVSLSGRNYFFFTGYFYSTIDWSKDGLIPKIANLPKIFLNQLHKKLHGSYLKLRGNKVREREMNKAVLYGNKRLHHWCGVSWKEHITPYINNPETLKVQYESVLKDPLLESKRILDFIGIKKDEQKILAAIEKQSFTKRKQLFLKEMQTNQVKFLREGKLQQWKTNFSKKENQLFVDLLKKELQELNYDLEK